MTTKRAALAAAVLALLRAHDARFRASEHLDDALLDGSATEKEQIRAMGSPARYAEVLYAAEGEALPGYTNARSRPTEGREVFEVNVWWEMARKGPRAADQAAWEALWKAPDTSAAPGLVTALQRAATLTSDVGGSLLVDVPTEAETYPVQIRTNVLAHFGRLLITVT